MAEDVGLDEVDALAAQYREARDAIGPARVVQARAEVAYGDALRRSHGDYHATDALAAKAEVDQAVVAVEWCKAAAIAAAEAFKGVTLADAIANNEANRVEHSHAAIREQSIRRIAEATG